jgi:hypothetical protein
MRPAANPLPILAVWTDSAVDMLETLDSVDVRGTWTSTLLSTASTMAAFSARSGLGDFLCFAGCSLARSAELEPATF